MNGTAGNDAWDGLCEVWDGVTCGPKATIQAGIDAATAGDTVLVADGVYVGTGNRGLVYNSKALTVRSENGPEQCTIDCEGADRGVRFGADATPDFIFDGFTIRNGDGEIGGAIMCRYGAAPTILNCTMRDCRAFRGGALYAEDSSPTLRYCTIRDSAASNGGGGVYCSGGWPSLRDCTIRGNTASGEFGENGGGVYLGPGGGVRDCTIVLNYARYKGGGVAISGDASVVGCTISMNLCSDVGGGVYCDGDTPRITRCAITRNSAFNAGGGVFCDDSLAAVTNCLIARNTTNFSGGGVGLRGNNAPTLQNCTLMRNSAVYRLGGGVYSDTTPLVMRNCIAWGNPAPELMVPTESTVTYCDVAGGWPGVGNIDADPQLSADGHLLAGSPCRDAGDPSGDYSEQTDIDGEARQMLSAVDIGADEWLDSDADGLSDAWEERYFGSGTAGVPTDDDDGDGRDNLAEQARSSNPLLAPRTFHVATTGDDGWDGWTPHWDGAHGPKATIQAAILAVDPYEGDEIIVADGLYTGPGNCDIVGYGVICTLRSAGGNPATCIIDSRGEGGGLSFHHGETAETAVSGFTVTTGHASIGVYCLDGDVKISNMIISQCHTVGLYLQGTIDQEIDNCIVVANDYQGIQCTLGSATLTNCTAARNGQYDLLCTAASPTLRNCILWSPAEGNVHLYASTPTFTYCDVRGVWEGEGNFDLDPGFIDPDNGDFHLAANSPCIGAGDPQSFGVGEFDIDGEPRVMGGRVDIGADEFTDRPFVSGDMNCDGVRDLFDIDPFVVALASQGHADPFDDYYALFPDCNHLNAETNGDGSVDLFDVDPFVLLLTAP